MDYDYLKFMHARGFQKGDEEHPAGSGKPGYRVVFKTLKLIPLPGAEIKWPNLRLRFSLDKTTRGGLKTEGGLESRRPNKWILPEYIDYDVKDGMTKFAVRPNTRFTFRAWEEEIDTSGLIEILLLTDSDKPEDIVNEGRMHLGKMKVVIELTGGERVLGVPIAEEVVEIFPDWEWNRNMSSFLLASESELNLERLNTEEFFAKIKPALELTQELSEEHRKRLAMASSWYWKGESELDPVNRFIEYWVSVESLEMPNTTNVRPVRERLESITGIKQEDWKDFVGRLKGIRSKLVHGEINEVPIEKVEQLRFLVLALMHGRLFPGEDNEVITRLLQLSGLKQ